MQPASLDRTRRLGNGDGAGCPSRVEGFSCPPIVRRSSEPRHTLRSGFAPFGVPRQSRKASLPREARKPPGWCRLGWGFPGRHFYEHMRRAARDGGRTDGPPVDQVTQSPHTDENPAEITPRGAVAARSTGYQVDAFSGLTQTSGTRAPPGLSPGGASKRQLGRRSVRRENGALAVRLSFNVRTPSRSR
jgi:hypothetical protein